MNHIDEWSMTWKLETQRHLICIAGKIISQVQLTYSCATAYTSMMVGRSQAKTYRGWGGKRIHSGRPCKASHVRNTVSRVTFVPTVGWLSVWRMGEAYYTNTNRAWRIVTFKGWSIQEAETAFPKTFRYVLRLPKARLLARVKISGRQAPASQWHPWQLQRTR